MGRRWLELAQLEPNAVFTGWERFQAFDEDQMQACPAEEHEGDAGPLCVSSRLCRRGVFAKFRHPACRRIRMKDHPRAREGHSNACEGEKNFRHDLWQASSFASDRFFDPSMGADLLRKVLIAIESCGDARRLVQDYGESDPTEEDPAKAQQ